MSIPIAEASLHRRARIAARTLVLTLIAVLVALPGASAAAGVEVMLVFDRSGSMFGQPITDLKVAAHSLVDLLGVHAPGARIGTVSFATAVRVDCPLDTASANTIHAAISTLSSSGFSNAEDAIAQAGGPLGLTDQSGVPEFERARQFVIFFGDGSPSAFRSQFVKRSTPYDAVVVVEGSCDPPVSGTMQVNSFLYDATSGMAFANSNPIPTGDGLASGSACGAANTTRWLILDTHPIPGYAPDACNIPEVPTMSAYVCDMAHGLALEAGQALKDRGVTIYAIGLGSVINTQFLASLASDLNTVYVAPTSAELASIAQAIGTGPVPVRVRSWGALKFLYR